MKWNLLAGLALLLAAGQASADSCWIITDLKGASASASDGYEFTKDGFSTSVFVLRISENPSVQVAGSPSSYSEGKMIRISDSMIIYVYATPQSNTEVWAVDADKGVAYVTQSRSGFGQFNKAAAFAGKAREGC
jgi:hypothetical protein